MAPHGITAACRSSICMSATAKALGKTLRGQELDDLAAARLAAVEELRDIPASEQRRGHLIATSVIRRLIWSGPALDNSSSIQLDSGLARQPGWSPRYGHAGGAQATGRDSAPIDHAD